MVISETLGETLECVACVGRTERLGELMRGSEYEGEDCEDDLQGHRKDGYVSERFFYVLHSCFRGQKLILNLFYRG